MTQRTGAVYMAVLMSSLIVASLAMAAITTAAYYARDLNQEGDFRQAQIAADAALEWAIANINATTNWRTAHANNGDSSVRSLGNATVRYRLIDSDGNLNDDPLDACDLLVTAKLREASYSWRATLEPAGPPLNCLNYSVAALNEINPQTLGVWSTDGKIASGGNISVSSGAYLTADCWATGSCSGNIYGSIGSLVGSLQIPAESVLEQYSQRGTAINASQFPKVSGELRFDGHLLSANSNTISGDLSPSGIYVIDCENQAIVITNSRLMCTLVLRNAGANTKIDQAVYWEAAQANYPALLVQGNIELSLTRSPLQESSVGINLNPAGTPYRGVADSNTSTNYPSQIRGMVFASGRLQLSNPSSENEVFGGLIGGEKLRGGGDLYVHYRDIYLQNPPPGFRSFDKVRISPGSVQRVATP